MSVKCYAYLGRCDDHLDLAAGSADKLSKLITDVLQESQAVVLGEGSEEVLDGLVGAGSTDALLELGDDEALVGVGQSRCR